MKDVHILKFFNQVVYVICEVVFQLPYSWQKSYALHTGIKKRHESGELLNLIKLEHKVLNECMLVDLDGQEIDTKTFNLKKKLV